MKKRPRTQGLSLVLALLAVLTFTIAATPQKPSGEKEPPKGEPPSKKENKSGVPSSGGKIKTDAVDLGGGMKLELVWIPGGIFQMGSPDSERGHQRDAGPVRTVELDGFWMGKTEVTQEQYQAVMGWGSIPRSRSPVRFRGARFPMDSASWDAAKVFCREVSQKTSKEFRLPTEAEWEYACRAGSATRFCFGDSDEELDKYAWYLGNSGYKLHPVGEKKPNKWGLYDMHGSVWEWCEDRDREEEHDCESNERKNPKGPSSGEWRVIRGGCCFVDPLFCQSAFRAISRPSSLGGNGFRVVCVSKPRS